MQTKRYAFLALLSLITLGGLLIYNWSPLTSRAPVASAHAFVIGSDPVDGSTVAKAPSVVRIFFNEDIARASIAHVFAPDEHIVDAARSRISPTNPRELDTPLVPPGSLPQGSYTVRWTALSNEDGHTTHGVIGFNIGQSSVGLPGQVILGPSTSNILPQLNLYGGLSVAWDWLVLLALTFWVGILVMEGLVLPRFGKQVTPDNDGSLSLQYSHVPLQWLCLAALLVGQVITLVLRSTLLTQNLGSSGIDLLTLGQLLTATTYGHLWLVTVVCIGCAMALLWWATRRQNTTALPAQAGRSKSRFSSLREQVEREAAAEFPIAEENVYDADIAGDDAGNVKEKPAEVARTQVTLDPARNTLPFGKDASAVGAISVAGQATRLPTWYMLAGLVLAGVILFIMALASDEAQLAQPHISAVVLNWLYLAAQSAWFGGLAYLAYVLLPLLSVGEPEHRAGMLTVLLRRLALWLLGTLGVLLVSGLFLSESSLSSAGQLISDPYGRALLVKIVLLVLMLALGLYVLFVTRPKLARQAALLPVVNADLPARRTRQAALEQTVRHLGQTLKVQSWLGAAALLCAALMTFYAPPIVFPAINYARNTSTTGTASSSATTVITQTQKVGDLTVTLLVLPGRVDFDNTVVLAINDSRGNPVTDAQVQLATNMELMDMGMARATLKGGSPTYITTFNKDAAFSMFGIWDITVRVSRPGAAPMETVFKVTLAQ